MLRTAQWNYTGLGEEMECETLEKPGQMVPEIKIIPFGEISQRFKLLY